eukprot:m.24244 g.24244  ORF g.24244 m.24244 type:complete len:334 (-) comp8569_c0_seq3:235-1236(-)
MAARPIWSGWATKRGGIHTNWKRRYFVLRDNNTLSYYTDQINPDVAKAKGVITLTHECKVIEPQMASRSISWPKDIMPGARFHIETPTRTFYIFCDSPQEVNMWMRHLLQCVGVPEEQIQSQFSTRSLTSHVSRMSSGSDQAHVQLREQLSELVRLQGNNKCFECHRRGPSWASVTLGVFVCLGCVAHHKALGPQVSQVKSIQFDSWTQDMVDSLKTRGNTAMKQVYEATLPADFERDFDDMGWAENFIRAKYIEQRWKQGAVPLAPQLSPITTITESPEQQPQRQGSTTTVDLLSDSHVATQIGGDQVLARMHSEASAISAAQDPMALHSWD